MAASRLVSDAVGGVALAWHLCPRCSHGYIVFPLYIYMSYRFQLKESLIYWKCIVGT